VTSSQWSDDPEYPGQYWENVTHLYPADEQIRDELKWRTGTLDLHGRDLPEVPAAVWEMTWLTELHLYYNRLTELPEAVGRLTGLTWLSLGHNRLTGLPQSITRLTRLERIDLEHNPLTEVPGWLRAMPGLKDIFS
jgi:Leucine-rich repeat (LRR) protein